MKTLIIEDNPETVQEITSCLKEAFPDVVVATVSEGQGGIELIKAEVFDLAIVTSTLSDMNVLHLIKHVRDLSDVPLIVIYKEYDDDLIGRHIGAGADEYLILPLDKEECSAKIKALIRFIDKIRFFD